MPFAISIPLPDLPKNLDKLDEEKIIVTACPLILLMNECEFLFDIKSKPLYLK